MYVHWQIKRILNGYNRNTYRTVVLVITLIRNSPLIEMKTLIACVVLCYLVLYLGAPVSRVGVLAPAPHRREAFFRCFSRRPPRLRSAPKLLRLFRYLSFFFFFSTMFALSLTGISHSISRPARHTTPPHCVTVTHHMHTYYSMIAVPHHTVS